LNSNKASHPAASSDGHAINPSWKITNSRTTIASKDGVLPAGLRPAPA